jgi:polyhydroxyalkanoate synthesis regulator phasin
MPQMPLSPDWKRYLEAGMQFTEMRRSQARAFVNDLVQQGHLAREQMSAAADEVMDISRRRTDELRKVVQKEVQRQLGSLGLATKADLAKLERRLTKATREAKKSPAKKSGAKATKKSTAKKTGAKAARKAG